MSIAEYDGFAVSNDILAQLEAKGCPVCGAPARRVKPRRTNESWRLHFRCRARIVGFHGGAAVEQNCARHLYDDLTARRLDLIVAAARRRHRRQPGRAAS